MNTSIRRPGVRRAVLLGASALVVTSTASCSPGSPAEQAAARSSAALSSAAEAAPGTYGAPVDPSLPNPTGVASDTPAPSAPSATADAAAVIVTYSGWVDTPAGVEVGAYLAGVAESGGTCTLTLTGSAGSATAEVTAEPDAASTSCPALAVPGSELSSGTWTAVVTYESPSTSGTSTPVPVVVP